MTPDQLQELKTELANTVRVVVNGKIEAIDKKLEAHTTLEKAHWEETGEHWKVTREFIDDLTPVRRGLFTINNLNGFLKWLGLPAIGAYIAYHFFK